MSEFNLMPFQDFPFNGDVLTEMEFLKLRDKFNVINVIETGSCIFTTTKWFSENFENVYTFEINTDFYNHGMQKVSDKTNISAHNCNSVDGLRMISGLIKGGTIFFLDAHWGENCPLLEEINEISKFDIDPIIAIHDFKTDNVNLGFDIYDNRHFDLNFINESLTKVYPNGYDYYYNNEALGAMRGLIYILPKTNSRYINRRIVGI
jgi:hypothetical protein